MLMPCYVVLDVWCSVMSWFNKNFPSIEETEPGAMDATDATDAILAIIQDIYSGFHRSLCNPTEAIVCAMPVEILEVFECLKTGSGRDVRLRIRAQVRCMNGVIGTIDATEVYYQAVEGQPADYKCNVEFHRDRSFGLPLRAGRPLPSGGGCKALA